MLICSGWPETADPAVPGFQRTLLRHAQVARGENWVKKCLILVLGFCQQRASPTEHAGDTEVRPVVFPDAGVFQSESQQSRAA